MSDFFLVFRMEPMKTQRSPEQMQDNMKLWMDWLGGLGAQNKLVSAGQRLEGTGSVVKANNLVTNGPYAETKELIGGFSIIKADSAEEATELSKGCPVLQMPGGSVEVRPIIPM